MVFLLKMVIFHRFFVCLPGRVDQKRYQDTEDLEASKGLQWPLALQLLRAIGMNDKPNVVAYGAAISACRRSAVEHMVYPA